MATLERIGEHEGEPDPVGELVCLFDRLSPEARKRIKEAVQREIASAQDPLEAIAEEFETEAWESVVRAIGDCCLQNVNSDNSFTHHDVVERSVVEVPVVYAIINALRKKGYLEVRVTYKDDTSRILEAIICYIADGSLQQLFATLHDSPAELAE